MMKRAICAILLIQLGACASEARWNRFEQTESALMQARKFASVDCSGIEECSQRWARTRQYVARYSATRIRRADQTEIETGRPLEAGVVYLWATRTPAEPGSERARIRLKGMCKGMYGMDGGPGIALRAMRRSDPQHRNEFSWLHPGTRLGTGGRLRMIANKLM